MCMGGSPQAPRIVYQGPSKAELAANDQQMQQYQASAKQQQQTFATQLQSQIDAANREAATRKAELDAEMAAAAAQSAAQQQAAYAVTTTTAEPVDAKVTEPPKKKDNTKGTLKIGINTAQADVGTGLNIGI